MLNPFCRPGFDGARRRVEVGARYDEKGHGMLNYFAASTERNKKQFPTTNLRVLVCFWKSLHCVALTTYEAFGTLTKSPAQTKFWHFILFK